MKKITILDVKGFEVLSLITGTDSNSGKQLLVQNTFSRGMIITDFVVCSNTNQPKHLWEQTHKGKILTQAIDQYNKIL